MKQMNLLVFILLCASLLFNGCKSKQQTTQTMSQDKKEQKEQKEPVMGLSSPPLLLYKTKADYSKNIPVVLSADKSEIISFPDIKDIYFKGKFAYPTLAEQGYLIDNRGIGINVAFISYTYEEYSQLKETPSAADLYNKIIDNAPLTELYNLGPRYNYVSIPEDVNEVIRENKLSKFEKLL